MTIDRLECVPHPLHDGFSTAPDPIALMDKINELIDVVAELQSEIAELKEAAS